MKKDQPYRTESLAGNQEEKESLCPLEEGAENSEGLRGCCEDTQGEN